VRQQLLDAIYGGRPFRTVIRDFGLTSNQVWGLTKTDEEWSRALDAALMATRRDDLEHGTNVAYLQGCVCSECREHANIHYVDVTAEFAGHGIGGLSRRPSLTPWVERPFTPLLMATAPTPKPSKPNCQADG
jgi:hypothetical protein